AVDLALEVDQFAADTADLLAADELAVGAGFQAFQQVLQFVDVRLKWQTMARRHSSLLGSRGRAIVMLCGGQDTEEGPGGQLSLPPHPKPCYRLSDSVWSKVHSR